MALVAAQLAALPPQAAHAQDVLQAVAGINALSAREDLVAPLAFSGPQVELPARSPLYADPGETFRYRDADPALLSYVLQYASSEHEAEFVRARLFEPLGIDDYF